MKNSLICCLAVLIAGSASAREKVTAGKNSNSQSLGQRVMAACAPPKASREFWFNNVRTIIYSGGDMWWDLNGNNNAYYYIPAVQNRNNGVSSTFAGSIWLGGLDAGGQLKVAAMTYRQNGIDFYPGPLDTVNASTDAANCARYDQIYNVTRAEVEAFVDDPQANMTSNILNWPGNGDVGLHHGRRLAPFVDVNFDGFYDPNGGDYPAYDIQNLAEKDNLGFCKTKLFGDYTLFWVFNDNGDIHTETQGVPIGVEVRAQAFAFKTNDEINNMTFYSYEIFNRSSFQLNQTYFTIWNDCDLGYYLDDYVGCDVERGLGYIYNADPYDETFGGINGYLDFPPAMGCDFFRGPLADPGDGINNDMDSLTDEPGETIQMSRFTYYNNNIGAFPPQTVNPDIAIHYYGYMTGFWKDGSPFTFGGNAYGGTAPATFVYDGNPIEGTGWTERGSGNLPGDRRFLQSAGPFTLKPGAVNEITFGLPWAQSGSKGGYLESLELLFTADDKAQALFDNCFKLLDGPEAPDMTIQEMENELIFYLTNEKGKSNNYKQFNNDYEETDISILEIPNSPIEELRNPDKKYRFEGYIVYQVRDDRVALTDLGDASKARVVFQCDVQNGVSRLINYEPNQAVGGLLTPVPKVEGADEGIRTTFRITEDAFSTLENRKLVNHKKYYFMSVAYAYNEYLPYLPEKSPEQSPGANFLGQKRPFLSGRIVKRASGIPHNTSVEKGGTVTQAQYGFGPKITRIEGTGNGGNRLTLTRASELAIVNSVDGFYQRIEYENGFGPIEIKVVDPLNVVSSDFTFRFINHNVKSPQAIVERNLFLNDSAQKGTLATIDAAETSWELKDNNTGRLYYPTDIKGQTAGDTLYQSIRVANEFYFPELGFSVKVQQVADPGERVNQFTDFMNLTENDGYTGPMVGSFISADITYENGPSGWLTGIDDVDGQSPENWILSGANKTEGFEDAYYRKNIQDQVQAFYDPEKQFGKVLGGTWAPYPLTASYYTISAGAQGENPARIFGGPGFNGDVWAQDDYFAQERGGFLATRSTPDQGNTDLRKTSSVLVVLTRDKTKWTRCVVLEMQEKSRLSQNHALFFSPRAHESVDKQGIPYGNPDNKPGYVDAEAAMTSTTGMGWFPGYAINIETGERLNMAFGEDSYQTQNNGADMVWNPTTNQDFPFQYAFGGKHFVYVFNGNTIESAFQARGTGTPYRWESTLLGTKYGVGKYDRGARMMAILQGFFSDEVLNYPTEVNNEGLAPFNAFERDIMWVNLPLVQQGYSFKHPDQMPSDVRIQINVAKPYRYGFAGIAQLNGQSAGNVNKLVPVDSVNQVANFIQPQAANNNFPLYNFNTSDIATLYDQNQVAKNALDMIRIVPNPYYGSSTYESRSIDNFVRITNLPNKCTIKIFTMNGMLVRTIKRDVSGTEDLYQESASSGDDIRQGKLVPYEQWDLKNQSNISIASGLYIIHVDAPGLGEKVLKWFGIMRPLDVQNY